MSRLIALADEHWRTYLPSAYAAIPDKEAFFGALADEALAQVVDLAESLCGDDPEDEPFAVRMGRYQMARANAEAQVLREVLLLPAEADQTVEDEADSTDLEQALADFHAARDEFWTQQT